MHPALRDAIERLHYPWPDPRERDVSRIEAATLAWARTTLRLDARTLERLRRVEVTRLAAITDPHVDDATLTIVARTMAWIFVEDDRHDVRDAAPGSTAALRTRLLRDLEILDGAPADARDPTAVALADIAASMRRHGSPQWYAWWRACMGEFWLDGLLREQWHREHGRTPDFEAYAALRIHTVGILPCLAFAELSPGRELGSMREDPRAARLAQLTSWIVACANDLCSFAKESAVGDRHNLVEVLRVHGHLDTVGAIEAVLDMHDQALVEYVALEAEIGDAPALRARAASCRAWMAGALQWQRGVARYAIGVRCDPAA